MLGVSFPQPARALFAALDLTALNPLELFSSECVNSDLASYDVRVVVATVGFVIVCAVNWLIYGVRRASAKVPAEALKLFTEHVSAFVSGDTAHEPCLCGCS